MKSGARTVFPRPVFRLLTLRKPAIAVVSSSSQGADASGGDENKPTQTNPVTIIVPISAAPGRGAVSGRREDAVSKNQYKLLLGINIENLHSIIRFPIISQALGLVDRA